MKEELANKLINKYPKMFPKEANWAYPAVEDGWYDLLDALCGEIQHHLDWERAEGKYEKYDAKPNAPEQVVVAQLKEKFGGLRFYVNGCDQRTSGMIQMAEAMSFHICEMCGSPGEQRKGSWIKTLCDDCVAK